MADLFAILGLDRSADDAAIRAAYKRRLRELHPDRNPGFREAATHACAELTEQFATYSADPAGYRVARGASSSPDADPGEVPSTGAAEVDELFGFASSLVELLAPDQKRDAARRAVVTGAKVLRRYVSRS